MHQIIVDDEWHGPAEV